MLPAQRLRRRPHRSPRTGGSGSSSQSPPPDWLEPRSGCCRGTGRALAPPGLLPPTLLTLPSSPDATEGHVNSQEMLEQQHLMIP